MNDSFICSSCKWKLRNEEVDRKLYYRCTICGTLYQLNDLKSQQTQSAEFYEQQEKEILASSNIASDQPEAKPEYIRLRDDPWEWIKASSGIRVEDENPENTQYPYISLLLILICISFYFFSKSSEEYILNPHNLFRKGGLTLISYSFLHKNLSHLFGNIIFLFPFISKVEGKLGHLNTLGFIIASATGGALMQVAFDQRGFPLLGASAVCFAYITYYGLAFKNNPLKVTYRSMFSGRMLNVYGKRSITAGGFVCTYILLEFWGIIGQKAGISLVSHLAHIGGATIAVIVYFITVDGSEKEN